MNIFGAHYQIVESAECIIPDMARFEGCSLRVIKVDSGLDIVEDTCM